MIPCCSNVRGAFPAAVLSAIALALSFAGTAGAAVITVTTSADVIDINPTTGTVADLPGPDGKVSFSEAMIASNHTPGHETVAFAIPQGDWTMQWLYPGRAVLVTSVGYYFRAFDEVTIDGTTQTAFTGDTNPNGNEVAIYGATLYLNGDNSTLTGFDACSVSLTGSSGRIEGNTGGIGIEVYGGGGALIRNNVASTIKIDRSSDNVVVGNTCTRLRVLGWVGGGQTACNNRVGGPDTPDRNYIKGMGTWSSEGYPSGFALQVFDSEGTLIQNNRIGTTPDGLAQGHEATTLGISLEGDNRNVTIRDNHIAGILGRGIGPHFTGRVGIAIYMTATCIGLDIRGNTIGLDALGAPVLGSVTGIDVGTWYPVTMTGIRIGGTGTGDANIIAGHRSNGILVGKDIAATRISGNRIHANAALGIDLVTTGYAYGVTPNDPLDADTGANGLQNFPELASAAMTSSGVRVTGTLRSAASSAYTIEFFASPACDDAGYGQADRFLGSAGVATGATGNAPFDVTLPVAVEPGWVVTATATSEPAGATSEFSACAVITDQRAASVPAGSDGASPDAGWTIVADPSPFREQTVIRYRLARSGAVDVSVYDASGRMVRRLVSGARPAGAGSVSWDARDDAGRSVAAGVYFCRLSGDGGEWTGRVVRIR